MPQTSKSNSKTKIKESIIQSAIEQLQSLGDSTNELEVKKITCEHWEKLEELIPNENTFRVTRKEFRLAITQCFPDSDEPKANYYYTTSTEGGKKKSGRFEHLALWYATVNKERWNVVGDDARKIYFSQYTDQNTKNTMIEAVLEPATEPATEVTAEPATEPATEATAKPATEPATKVTAEPATKTTNFNLENLGLDPDAHQIVVEAIAGSGLSEEEFFRQALIVYARTVSGKARKHTEDLSAVETEELRHSGTYGNHPIRARELVKRAIMAIKISNGNATELSQKWFITQSLLCDMTGSKPPAIKVAMANYQNNINDMNKVLSDSGATSLINRKPDKEIFCTNWAQLVPSGLA